MKPDTRLGTYEIVEKIGAGGMGEVYRARDTRLGREVALKVLPADVAADTSRLALFEREARSVASLNHPNIVTLFSVEDEAGTRFLTMELVEGESLAESVVSGGMPPARVVELGIELAEALAAAHEKGIVHRDLKPANVMLTRDGRVKVLDFGLAKLETPDSGLDVTRAATEVMPLSGPGQVLGTVPYMAPEQVRGESVDGRTDVFALGILLYELATGRQPFQGATAGVISSAILTDVPESLVRVRADAPAALERIISRCLEKDPRARFQTALDVSNELQRVGSDRDERAFLKQPPTPSTPLLGREENIVSAVARLHDGVSLLTVTGYGGTGKTRFSIELFRRLAPEYEGGAAFVSLASVTAAADVLPTIASTLDIAEAHGRSALEALCTVIGDHHVLLVLDNLEQVLDAAEEIAVLVSRCPALQVVATSRAPLKVGAESEFALPPLELPAGNEHSLQVLEGCPSVALFLQRAARVKPDFALTADNAAAVTAICRRLDGLPLALELAAARARILKPDALLQRLDHALDLLTSGDRDLPLRQRTLRATISWSYSLLEPQEQRLLRCCSVFHDGWTFEAMEQVCYTADDRYRALDELESLVEKGLVRVVGSGERYSLLETIRAFSAEQLHAGGEVESVRNAHAAYFVQMLAELGAQFRTTGQIEAVRLVRADNANELAAIHWLTAAARAGDSDALEAGLLLCGHLDWFWHVHGQHNTARALLDELLALAADLPASRGRALSLLAAGMVSSTTGEWDRSLGEWQGGHEDGKALGDEELAAEGSMGMSYAYLSTDRPEEAVPWIDDAIARSAGGVSDFVWALTVAFKGLHEFGSGDVDGGVALVEEARAVQERIGDCEGGGIALSFLAQMYFARGDLKRARETYDEALATFAAVGDRPEIARVHVETGWTALADEDAGAAQRSFRLAVQMYEEVGSPRGTGLALLGLAAVEVAEGRPERAVAVAEAAHALTERAGVVCDHPMDAGVTDRIEALKESIPKTTVDGLVTKAGELSPAAILAMLEEQPPA